MSGDGGAPLSAHSGATYPGVPANEGSARKNIAVWDKEYAEQLLGKILKQR